MALGDGLARRGEAPRAVVLTGRHASLDALARVVYAARREGADPVAVYDYRGALPDTGASTVERLPRGPEPPRAGQARRDGHAHRRRPRGRRAPVPRAHRPRRAGVRGARRGREA